MNDAIQKFKELIAGIQTVAICTDASNDIQKTLSAATLHRALSALGKKSILTLEKCDPKTKEYLELLLGPLASSHQEEQLIIKLNTQEMPVSELKYEKEGDIFKIILDSTGTLDSKKLIIETNKRPVDLLILIEPKESDLPALLNATPHREVVKIAGKDRGLGVKVADILSALLDSSTPGTTLVLLRTALWKLLDEQEKERTGKLEDIIAAKGRLLKEGVDFETLHNAESVRASSSFWKLFGRALVRSEFEKRFKTLWAFLPYSDFQKTTIEDSSVVQVFEKLRSLRPEAQFLVLLWEQRSSQDKKTVSAIVGGASLPLPMLATAFGSALSSSYFFVNGFQTFSEAELAIRSAISRII